MAVANPTVARTLNTEARSALIDGAGLDFPGAKLTERTALLIEAAREVVDQGGDPTDTALEVVDGSVVYYTDVVELASDTLELYLREPESETELAPMASLQMVVTEALEAAVRYALTV